MKKNEKTFEEKMAELEELIGKLESGLIRRGLACLRGILAEILGRHRLHGGRGLAAREQTSSAISAQGPMGIIHYFILECKSFFQAFSSSARSCSFATSMSSGNREMM